jgi:hypothetical protein
MRLFSGARDNIGYTQLAQNEAHWAKVGETELEQVETNESCEGQSPVTQKHRTLVHSQCQRHQDEQAREDADVTFDSHFLPRFKN